MGFNSFVCICHKLIGDELHNIIMIHFAKIRVLRPRRVNLDTLNVLAVLEYERDMDMSSSDATFCVCCWNGAIRSQWQLGFCNQRYSILCCS
jgi:hypothetical protein